MASSSGKRAAIAGMLVVVLLVAGAGLAGAARPMPAAERSSSGGEAYLAVYPAAVAVAEEARKTVDMLLQRLPAGPSPKGPGH
ncbi:uncharacterized protein LOC104584706 [Brachypodium distachyon]|uniref:Uncharacterized protein n=1 Tax=Brachypodium distachyon TaxID=15368 RepID=A0A0Q3PNI4_BRADI|nr:uncharacterized protein LOC104584706 [Brachypodium distachyon]KQJ91033.1 hypothetical protein BRADI_4g35214v3 [Brachypodium distachyon]|eukprot:XP_010238372.1 uncharacterized protein LOC104584706 [Brachypodium distachyon]